MISVEEFQEAMRIINERKDQAEQLISEVSQIRLNDKITIIGLESNSHRLQIHDLSAGDIGRIANIIMTSLTTRREQLIIEAENIFNEQKKEVANG